MDTRSSAAVPVRFTSPGCFLVLALATLLAACGGSSGPASSRPTFTAQPVAQTATEGGSATFTATASGTPAPTFQWERSAEGTAWAPVGGATAATYTFTALAADHGAQFRAKAINSAGTATSASAVLTVNIAPVIAEVSQNLTVTEGQSATFLVLAKGTAPLHYQWKKDGVKVGTDIEAFKLSFAQAGDAGSYTVAVTNLVGTETSAAMLLTVNPLLDWKGLTAEEEARYGLNPNLLDTDGDGISDYDEIKKFGFDPANDPYKFNPLIADVPRVKVELISPPAIQIKYGYTDGTSATNSTERSSSSSKSVSNSYEHGYNVNLEVAATVGGEAAVSILDTGAKVSASVTATAGLGTSYTWSSEQAVENSLALSQAEGNEISHEVSASEAKMGINVKVTNTGNMAFTLKNLILSGSSADRFAPDFLMPIGNIEYESSNSATYFPETTLAPGESIAQLGFSNRLLYVDTAKALLRSSNKLFVDVVAQEIGDPLTGVPYNGQMTEIRAKTATVTIDYDAYSGRESEKFFVATNLCEGAYGVSLKTLLERHLFLPYLEGAVGSNTGLKKVRAQDYSATDHAKWVVTHVSKVVGELKVMQYDITKASYTLADIIVRAGDVVSLLYVVDKDGDGLPHRLEQAIGTSDEQVDSNPGDSFPGDSAWFLAGRPVVNPGPTVPGHRVFYNGNGNTGGMVPSDTRSYAAGAWVRTQYNTGFLEKINVDGVSSEFIGWNTNSNGTGTFFYEDWPLTMGSDNVILYAIWRPYQVGSTGPAGGLISFVKDYYSDGWRYLEAAPYDEPRSQWINNWDGEPPSSNGNRLLGAGLQNTIDIDKVAQSYGIAADRCINKVTFRTNQGPRVKEFNDWFLPSVDELVEMAKTTRLNGRAMVPDFYWSSSYAGLDNTGKMYIWCVVINNDGTYQSGTWFPSVGGVTGLLSRAARRF